MADTYPPTFKVALIQMHCKVNASCSLHFRILTKASQ
jgi:predicted amidohydrolase